MNTFLMGIIVTTKSEFKTRYKLYLYPNLIMHMLIRLSKEKMENTCKMFVRRKTKSYLI